MHHNLKHACSRPLVDDAVLHTGLFVSSDTFLCVRPHLSFTCEHVEHGVWAGGSHRLTAGSTGPKMLTFFPLVSSSSWTTVTPSPPYFIPLIYVNPNLHRIDSREIHGAAVDVVSSLDGTFDDEIDD